MGNDVKPIVINLGCGFHKEPEMINVDAYDNCKPDVLWDLNVMPWPWGDKSVDGIFASHLMEHLADWFSAFNECSRILKPGGMLQIHVPDHTSTEDMGYIDHHALFTRLSFHMIMAEEKRGANAWAVAQPVVPLKMIQYAKVVRPQFIKWWFPKWLLKFCTEHLVNFALEQRFIFIKTG
jgi:predicted SAM-dependent methyltransferase